MTRVADVTDADLNLTARVDFDTFMLVLVARQERVTPVGCLAPGAANPKPFLPPLLEWMIRPEDEAWVDVLEEKPREQTQRPVRRPVDVPALRRTLADLEARRDRLQAQHDRLGATHDDPAACRLSGRTIRQHWARMDRELERAVELGRQIRRLDFKILDVEAKIKRAEASAT